jgi:hypothetical protein
MFDRLKRVVVGSLIGAIALGYILAQAILDLVGIFTAPLEAWAMRNIFRGLVPGANPFSGSSLRAALSPAFAFILLLLVWYLLLRWWYFTPLKTEAADRATS